MASWAAAGRMQVWTRGSSVHESRVDDAARRLGRADFFFDELWEL